MESRNGSESHRARPPQHHRQARDAGTPTARNGRAPSESWWHLPDCPLQGCETAALSGKTHELGIVAGRRDEPGPKPTTARIGSHEELTEWPCARLLQTPPPNHVPL